MGAPATSRFLYVTATPGTIYIDTGSGIAKPYTVNTLYPVFDDVNNLVTVHLRAFDTQPLLPGTLYSNVGCYVDGVVQAISSLTDLITYVATYFNVSSAGGGGGNATAANQATEIAKLGAIVAKLPGLGQQTMAASLPVAIAVDQTAVNVITDATENHIGEVARHPAQIAVTPVISAAAYTAGQVVGGVLTFANALRLNGGRGTIESVLIIDKDGQAAAMTLLLFARNPSNGTYTNHATIVAMNATDLSYTARAIKVTAANYFTYPGGIFAVADVPVGEEFVNTGGDSNVYGLLICTGTPTYTSTSSLTVKLGILQD